MKRIEFYAERSSFGAGLSLHARIDGAVASPATFGEQEEGVITPPLLQFDMTAAQRLMDELWQCGLRPTEGAGSAGQSAAMQSHLADLRAIAFKALKIEGAA